MISRSQAYGTEVPQMTLRGDGVLHIVYPSDVYVTPEHFERTVERAGAMEGGPFPILVEGEKANPFDRRMMEITFRPETLACVECVAIVSRNSIGRFLGNVFISLMTMPYPVRVFRTPEEGLHWLAERGAADQESGDVSTEMPPIRSYEEGAAMVDLVLYHHDNIRKKLNEIQRRQQFGNHQINTLELSFLRQEHARLHAAWATIQTRVDASDANAELREQAQELALDIADLQDAIGTLI